MAYIRKPEDRIDDVWNIFDLLNVGNPSHDQVDLRPDCGSHSNAHFLKDENRSIITGREEKINTSTQFLRPPKAGSGLGPLKKADLALKKCICYIIYI